MRISDWSSDVCSSDLRIRKRRLQDSRGPAVIEPPCLAQQRIVGCVLEQRVGKGVGRLLLGFPAEELRLHQGRQMLLQQRLLNLGDQPHQQFRSEEHTSELQSLLRNSYAVFCLKKKHQTQKRHKS